MRQRVRSIPLGFDKRLACDSWDVCLMQSQRSGDSAQPRKYEDDLREFVKIEANTHVWHQCRRDNLELLVPVRRSPWSLEWAVQTCGSSGRPTLPGSTASRLSLSLV